MICPGQPFQRSPPPPRAAFRCTGPTEGHKGACQTASERLGRSRGTTETHWHSPRLRLRLLVLISVRPWSRHVSQAGPNWMGLGGDSEGTLRGRG